MVIFEARPRDALRDTTDPVGIQFSVDSQPFGSAGAETVFDAVLEIDLRRARSVEPGARKGDGTVDGRTDEHHLRDGAVSYGKVSRGDWIRTSDLYVPNVAQPG